MGWSQAQRVPLVKPGDRVLALVGWPLLVPRPRGGSCRRPDFNLNRACEPASSKTPRLRGGWGLQIRRRRPFFRPSLGGIPHGAGEMGILRSFLDGNGAELRKNSRIWFFYAAFWAELLQTCVKIRGFYFFTQFFGWKRGRTA